MATLRGINTPPLEQEMIRKELDDVRFSKDQADLAELWMLFGDWRYRTKDQNRIMLSDFFPPIESIQYLIDQKGLIVMKIEVYQKTVRDAGKRGYMSGQAERPKEESREAPAPSEITTAILDRWKAEEERDEWKRKHRMVSDDYSAECHENAKLRTTMKELNARIHELETGEPITADAPQIADPYQHIQPAEGHTT